MSSMQIQQSAINPVAERADTTVAESGKGPRWTVAQVGALFDLPFNDLLYRAQQVHRAHHDPNAVQLSTLLLSVKTGGCAEDCGYCPQAARYAAGAENPKHYSRSKKWSPPPRPRKNGAPAASAWARPGVARNKKTWNRSSR